MNSTLRAILGTLSGIVAAWSIIGITDAISRAYARPMAITTGGLLFMVAGWFLGSFTGVVLSSRIGRNRRSAIATAAVVMLSAIVDALFFTHTPWFRVSGLTACTLGTILALRLVSARHTVAPAASAP